MIGALVLAAIFLLPWHDGQTPLVGWIEQRYAGRTEYDVRGTGQLATVRARANGQNSAMLKPVNLDPRGAMLTWRWRVLEHPSGADPDVRARDDRAAGVLVIVRRSILPWRTRALLYQWSEGKTRGLWSRSPYAGSVRTLVVESAGADSTWREVQRDLEADLRTAFGEVPERIEAIGIVCDADNTHGRSEAEFGPLEVVRGR